MIPLRLLGLSAHLDHLDRLIGAMQARDLPGCAAALQQLSEDPRVPKDLRLGAWALAEAIRRGLEAP